MADRTGTDPQGLAVILLAGGLGSRLRPAVADRPKVLAPVAGRAFLDWQLALLAASGSGSGSEYAASGSGLVDEVVLSLGHRAEQVFAHLDACPPSLPVRWVVEDTPLGTGGGAVLAARAVRAPLVLVMNGDTFLGLEIGAMLRDHRTAGGAATMAIVHQDDRSRYGGVTLDGNRVAALQEKAGDLGPGPINAGAYMMARTELADRPIMPLSMETTLLPDLIARGLVAHRAGGPFLDIGLPETYARAATVLPQLLRDAGIPCPPPSDPLLPGGPHDPC